jgi:hypothetical protein
MAKSMFLSLPGRSTARHFAQPDVYRYCVVLLGVGLVLAGVFRIRHAQGRPL